MSGPLPPQDQSWEDLLGARPQRGQDEVIDAVKHELGISARRVRYAPPDGPDVHGLADDLGLLA